VPVLQIYSSPSPEATRLFAHKLSARLQAGDVVLLQGNLGAGKTEFVKGMAEGFGVADPVTSPTFALLNIYQGRIPLYHFDLYRLHRVEELFEIGFDEFVGGDGVALVEWPELFAAEMPSDHLQVAISRGEGLTERTIAVEPKGSHFIKRWEGSEPI
jgi:tRNA threonylcarbamoyladenosine biosynthesis protein TsaE